MAITTKYYKRGTSVHPETYDPSKVNGTGGNDPNLTGAENEARFWSIRDGKNSNWGNAEIGKEEYDILVAFREQGGAQQGKPNAQTQAALKEFSDDYKFTAEKERTFDDAKALEEARAKYLADPANPRPTDTGSQNLVFRNGITYNEDTGKIIGVGDLRGSQATAATVDKPSDFLSDNSGSVSESIANAPREVITVNGQRIHPNDPNYDIYLRQLVQSGQATTGAATTTDTATTDTTATTTDEGLSEEEKSAINQLNADIDAMTDLSIEQKAILKQIAQGDYTSGQKIPSGEELSAIIDDAAMNAKTDLEPYYARETGRQLEDFQTGMEDIRGEASRFAASEAVSYKDTLAKTKAGLRAKGLTFSGKSRAEIGAETALAEGGRGIEGALPEARRLDYQDRLAGLKQRGRDLSIKGERDLGTEGIGAIGTLADPYKSGTTFDPNSLSKLYDKKQPGDVGYVETGDTELEKLAEIEKSKWDRVSKYKGNI